MNSGTEDSVMTLSRWLDLDCADRGDISGGSNFVLPSCEEEGVLRLAQLISPSSRSLTIQSSSSCCLECCDMVSVCWDRRDVCYEHICKRCLRLYEQCKRRTRRQSLRERFPSSRMNSSYITLSRSTWNGSVSQATILVGVQCKPINHLATSELSRIVISQTSAIYRLTLSGGDSIDVLCFQKISRHRPQDIDQIL